jgi:penicillin-binding protein 1B
MQSRDEVTETAVRKAIDRPVARRISRHEDEAAFFADLAREEIGQRISLPKSGEVRIQTTLDPELQRSAVKGIREGIERIERTNPMLGRGRVQASLVAIEPSSGAIRALVGGRSYRESSFNRATRAARQPGSLFKPFVYLAAFEAQAMGRKPGITPASLVRDDPTAIPDGMTTWSPQNYDHQFRGQVTVRRALETSLNIPAVRIACEVGLREVARLARALGIVRPLAAVPSLALGTSEVTLLEITGAYATLANQGIRTFPTTLISDLPVPQPLSTKPLPKPERVVSAESAFLITHLLRGVLQSGTASATARWGLSHVGAGKTGTTDNLRDAWFIGYTPDLAIGVWVGLDDGSPLGIPGAKAALPIWASVMQTVVQRKPPGLFTKPPGVVLAAVDPETGRRALPGCNDGPTIMEAFRAGTEPRASACDRPPVTSIIESLSGWFERLLPNNYPSIDLSHPKEGRTGWAKGL